ncbi:hypothetical protein G5C60_04205 [Streptomyces sp. HC44]|uniref:Uncharacterized protein n=1 Tax=Streptomyces scabichelini TaxID=2711217 RepID=A0A6G4UYQ9_9ACTN|nr:hypothetical protein [Streptomyces scabichelini]NGO06891.1 hypothetical protein [Streptomyces scabichelini]
MRGLDRDSGRLAVDSQYVIDEGAHGGAFRRRDQREGRQRGDVHDLLAVQAPAGTKSSG